ncbi:MAG: SPFH domain-containing protein, partial [Clostridia bacterium]|nr:SPFH domain-containing protein [Clostridia bacterium]
MCFRRKPKKIDPKINIETKDLVIFQKLRRGRLFLNTKVYVPRNFDFAICSNNKVLDILDEGEQIVSLKDLPNATRKLELYKVDKKGRPPKFFQAETYFVNLNYFENFKWGTSSYAELEDKTFGEYRTFCYGDLNFKIIEPIRFLNYILGEAKIIQLYSNESTKIVSRFINERMVRIINKINPTAKKLYLKDNQITKEIFEKLSVFLCEIGIGLNYLSLAEAKFPPKIYNELNKISKRPTDDSYWKDEEPVIDCGIGSPMSKEQD